MKNSSEKDAILAQDLLATAKRLVAADEDGGEDPKMNEKLRTLKSQITKLNAKRNKTLKQMGIQQNIKTTAKVEDLVDMLLKMVTT